LYAVRQSFDPFVAGISQTHRVLNSLDYYYLLFDAI
jgi:hypothetical protein